MSTTIKYPNITVKLVGEDGNAFAIMGRVTSALRRADVPLEERIKFREECMSDNYDNLLRICMTWVYVT